MLLRKRVSCKSGKAKKDAFESKQNMLHSSLVLVHYDLDRELVLCTDASTYSVGSVLSYRCPGGLEQPIAYASISLSVAERNYSEFCTKRI